MSESTPIQPTENPTPADTGSSTAVAPRQRPTPARVEQPKQWNVVLLDDDEHSYDYVIRLAQKLFHVSVEQAFQIAKTVDNEGRAVCMTTHKELAELKRDQVHAFGADPQMSSSKGSMSSVIEPVA